MREYRGSEMAGMWITRLGIKTTPAPRTKTIPVAAASPKPRDQGSSALHASIWASLSDDVLDKILSRLPLASLVRMQAVCKRWKIKLHTRAFIRQCEAQVVPWYLTFTDTSTCHAYDAQIPKWHTLSLAFLPSNSAGLTPLAAADGLVCLSAGARDILICNPVTRFWREVATPRELSTSDVAALSVDKVQGSYKLIIVGEDHRNDCTRLVASVFASASHSWRVVDTELLAPLESISLHLCAHLTRAAVVSSAVCEGLLYCLAARPYQLHAFDVFSEEWTRLRLSLPVEASGATCSLVAPRRGRLFLVGAYRHNHRDNESNVGIWELDQRRWRVVDVLLHRQGRCPSPLRDLSAGGEDVVVFVKWATRVLAYNVSRKSWAWVLAAQAQQEGFLFAPSLLLP